MAPKKRDELAGSGVIRSLLSGFAVAALGFGVWSLYQMTSEEEAEEPGLGPNTSVMESAGVRVRDTPENTGRSDPGASGNKQFTVSEVEQGIENAGWTEAQRTAFVAQLYQMGQGEQFSEWQMYEARQKLSPSIPGYVSESELAGMIAVLP